MGFIYMLTSPSGKSYIGQTIRTIEKRFGEHQESSSCRVIYNAIQKYGWENFDKDWYECPDEELDNHEELMIEVLGTLVPNGYNLREGGGNGKLSEETKRKIGEANTGKIRSEETKKKMSEANRGDKHPMFGKTPPEETKQKMRETQLGKKLSEEHKTKIGESHKGEKNGFYGKTHTEETKRKLSEANVGKSHSDETKQKLSEARKGEKNAFYGKTHSKETKQKIGEANRGEKNHNSKKVYQYSLDGVFIDSFNTCEEAGHYLQKDVSSICKCARGVKRYKTAYGFKWSYEKI